MQDFVLKTYKKIPGSRPPDPRGGRGDICSPHSRAHLPDACAPLLLLRWLRPCWERLTNEGRRAENRGRRPTAGVGLLWRGSKPPPQQLGGLGRAVSSPSGVWGGAPIVQRFSTIFSTQGGLAWHYNIVLLRITNKMKNSYLIPSWVIIIVHLMLSDFLVYETKFTARKSQEVVFTAGKRRGRWAGIRHFGGIPKRCLDKNVGTATVRKLASKHALGVRGIASHHKWLNCILARTFIPVLLTGRYLNLLSGQNQHFAS